jgi:hypothetical protein
LNESKAVVNKGVKVKKGLDAVPAEGSAAMFP